MPLLCKEPVLTSPDLDLETLALALFDIGAVRLGNFKLHSGRTSPIYLDLRLLVSFPDVLRQVTAAYRAKLSEKTFDVLAATPLAGLPIGTSLCLEMNVPLIYPRKSVKGYGTRQSIEGKWRAGQTAMVIDDLVTSGDSIIQAIAALEENGLKVAEAMVLIDREQGGAETLQAQGYMLHAVMNLRDLLAVLEARGRITADQFSQVVDSLI